MAKNKAPTASVITYDVGNGVRTYNFHYYVNSDKRYVALCNTVGAHDLYGEGHTWWAALSNCWEKVQQRLEKESRKRKKKSWEPFEKRVMKG